MVIFYPIHFKMSIDELRFSVGLVLFLLDTYHSFYLHRLICARLIVVLPYIGDNIAYQHGLHFCQEVYSYRNQNKV